MGKKEKKNKRWRLKLEEDDSFSLSPHKPLAYRGKDLRSSVNINKRDLRHGILTRLYDAAQQETKVRIFFQTFTFDRGSMEADLLEACWELL